MIGTSNPLIEAVGDIRTLEHTACEYYRFSIWKLTCFEIRSIIGVRGGEGILWKGAVHIDMAGHIVRPDKNSPAAGFSLCRRAVVVFKS